MRGALGALLVISLGLLMFPVVGAPYVLLLAGGGALIYKLTGRGAPTDYLKKLDELLFAGERVLVTSALIVMTVTVFVDVVWRTARSADTSTRIGFAAAFFVLSMIAGFTAKWEGASAAKRVGAGFVGFVIIMLSTFLISLAPNGFGWSQRLALVLILWVGMLGASMTTKMHRHITVDAVRRVVPEHLRRAHEIAAGVATVALTAFLAVLAIHYVQGNWDDWIESEMTAGIFESIPIPYWVATVPIIIGFGLASARFAGILFTGVEEVDLLESLGGTGESEDEA